MREYGRERKAEGEDVVVCQKIGSESVLVKCIVFGILNDEEGAKGQLRAVFGAAICFMGSGDAVGY